MWLKKKTEENYISCLSDILQGSRREMLNGEKQFFNSSYHSFILSEKDNCVSHGEFLSLAAIRSQDKKPSSALLPYSGMRVTWPVSGFYVLLTVLRGSKSVVLFFLKWVQIWTHHFSHYCLLRELKCQVPMVMKIFKMELFKNLS